MLEVLDRKTFSMVIFILAIVARIIFPGDSPFVSDEANFLNVAYNANLNGDFFTLGLEGAKGVKYGPFSIYYFRILLLLSKNPILISTFNTIFLLILKLSGIFLISREKKLNFLELASYALLSPFLWFYGRSLWDNSLNQVVTIYLIFTYLKFLNTEKFRFLFWVVLTANIMFHIHPMSLYLFLTIGLHLIFYKRSLLKQEVPKLIFILGVNLFVASPYLSYFIPELMASQKSPLRRPFKSFTDSFFIAQLFSTFKFSYFLGKDWWFSINRYLGYFLVVLGSFTWISYFFFTHTIISFFKGKIIKDDLVVLSLVAIFSQAFMNCFFKIYGHPHYIALNWFFGLYLIYLSARQLYMTSIVYRCSMLIVLYSIIASINLNRGSRSLHYGHTIENLVEISKDLNQWSIGNVESEVFHVRSFPHAINTIRKIIHERSVPLGEKNRATIFYTKDQDKFYAGISVKKVDKVRNQDD